MESFCDFLPPHLQQLAKESSEAGLIQIPKSDATLYRKQLVFHVSLILYRRAHEPVESAAHYLYIDSSEYLGRDWYTMKCHSINFEDLTDAHRIVKHLVRTSHPYDDDDDELEMPFGIIHGGRANLYLKLQSLIRRLTLTPNTFATGFTKLEDKVAALSFGISIEFSLPKVRPFCCNVISVTSDFGTEHGAGDFETQDPLDCLPGWVKSGNMQVDVESDDEPDLDDTSSYVFPYALRIAGTLHIFANAANQVDQHLLFFAAHYKWLKTIEPLLVNPQLLRRYMWTCLRESEYKHEQPRFSKRKFPNMYEKRWNEVLTFAQRLEKVLAVLILTYCDRKFTETIAQPNEDDWRPHATNSEFKPAELAAVLRNKFHPAYNRFMCLVNSTLESGSAYVEKCPCHEFVQTEYMTYVPADVARAEFGSACGQAACVCRGCRSPNLANEDHMAVFRAIWQTMLETLISACRSKVSAEDWAVILQEFDRARTHIMYIVLLKLSHCTRLPWFLCILAHSNVEIARAGAGTILELFAKSPFKHTQHRLVWTLCRPGSLLRAQLIQFRDGVPLQNLPELFREVLKLKFIPCIERTVEAGHGIAFRAGTHKRNSPLTTVMALKYPEVERDILPNIESWNRFCECAAKAQKLPDLANLLGLTMHPWIREFSRERERSRALQQHAAYHNLVPILSSIITRCDDISQFKSHAHARAYNKAAKKARLTSAMQQFPAAAAKRALTASAVQSNLATSHFRDHVKDSALFTYARDGEALDNPHLVSLQAAVDRSAPTQSGDMQIDIADDAGENQASALLAFRLVHKRPGRQKVPELSAAAGRKIGADMLAVCKLGLADTTNRRVSLSMDNFDNERGAISVISFNNCRIDRLRGRFFVHEELPRVRYTLQGVGSNQQEQQDADAMIARLMELQTGE